MTDEEKQNGLARKEFSYAITKGELGTKLMSTAVRQVKREKTQAVIGEVKEFVKHLDGLQINLEKTQREINFYNKLLQRIDSGDFEISREGKILVKGMWNGYPIGLF